MINKLTSEDRGQVGIGTIIVFIAMVLVAAIAAGVLITTAGELQEQSSSTASETEDQVSNLVEIEGVIGETPSSSNKIKILKVTHSLAAGSDPIDIQDLTWTIESGGYAETYSFVDINSADPDGDPLTDISDSIQQGSLLVNQEDRIEVEFNLEGDSTTGLTETGITTDDGENGDGSTPIADGETVTLSTSNIDENDDAERLSAIEDIQADTGGGTVNTDVTSDFSIVDANSGQIEYTDSGSGTLDEIDVTFTRSTGGLQEVDSVGSDETVSITVNAPSGGERYFGTITPNYIDIGEASYRLK